MPIPLRSDFDAAQLRRIACESEDARQVRRLLALAAIYDRGSRTQAAELGGVTSTAKRPDNRRVWRMSIVRHGDDEPASCRDLSQRRTRPPRGAVARPGRLAPFTKLIVPDNITIVPLPPKFPELNTQENVRTIIDNPRPAASPLR